ncbi:helix-turn-helix domain-containing protein [Sphingobacterium sp. UDSM-2020]|uniref:helix-turn-helix domain-containing protein n=1 Tax=Sphingobacterium sp. UDSM-2020 TaxID=2795738 RepID=UPI0019353118|nr:helix-turn-helix domain-containing protein [Sphingobacterium sp. UDSM-2020]QQD13727.1 helix-turn-helix domain-containing protein [Sphingobacterium sp. UDSM-2020]
MAIEILTREDLAAFKAELLNDLRNLFSGKLSTQKKWIKTKDVVKMLQISPGTLQNYRINGTINYSKIGNTIYYSLEDIQSLLNSSSTNPKS